MTCDHAEDCWPGNAEDDWDFGNCWEPRPSQREPTRPPVGVAKRGTPSACHWTGESLDDWDFTNPQNWQDGRRPQSGDVVVFARELDDGR
jgi:hypothetical protein